MPPLCPLIPLSSFVHVHHPGSQQAAAFPPPLLSWYLLQSKFDILETIFNRQTAAFAGALVKLGVAILADSEVGAREEQDGAVVFLAKDAEARVVASRQGLLRRLLLRRDLIAHFPAGVDDHRNGGATPPRLAEGL